MYVAKLDGGQNPVGLIDGFLNIGSRRKHRLI
jgi:hypothetical protein